MAPCIHPARVLCPLLDARDYITGGRFQVAFCSRCRLHVTVPVPMEDALTHYYPDAYFGSPGEQRFPASVEYFLRVLSLRRARKVERMNRGQQGRILDIGCGRGWLLHAFRAQGWEVMGTELSEKAAVHARERLRIPVMVGELVGLHFPGNHFDAIVLWHVLEHVRDPIGLLAEVQRILRPGGSLLVSTPNFGSLMARMSGRHWFPLDVPRHLTHWRPDTLREALARANFHTVRCSFFAAEYDLFGFIQSVLNTAGFRQNLLYNLLRRGEAKILHNKNVSAVELFLCVALTLPLSVLGVPVTLLLSLLHSGMTVTVFARKQKN